MKVSLKRHLQAVALAQLPQQSACAELNEVLGRFGPTCFTALQGWSAVRDYLRPLHSMPTRYVVATVPGWSLLLSNMRLEARHVEALALSRRTGVLAVSACLMEDSRQFHLMRSGQEVRDVACYKDGSKWFFVARGEPQPWEATELYSTSRKSERLTPEMVALYLEQVTGLPFPLAWRSVIDRATGIERSTKDARVPIATFEVEDDV